MQKAKVKIQNFKKILASPRGFTLIEMLVVIAIITIIGTMATQIILSLIRSNNKTSIQNEVKQNGSFVIDRLERDIRGSSDVTSPDSEHLNLQQADGSEISYVCIQGSSSSNGDITRGGQSLLNTEAVTGVRVNNCSFGLQNTAPVLVTIAFTLIQPYQSPNRSDLTITQNFRTSVSLRTY